MNNLPILYTIPIWNLTRGYGDKEEIFIPWTNEWINKRWVKRKVENFDEEYYYQRWILNKTVKSEYVIPKCEVCGNPIKYKNLFGNHSRTCSRKCMNYMLNHFPEYEESRIKCRNNNPVLQEGGLTIYLRNHPERGLDNRLKAYKDRRLGFGYMHDNKESEDKWKRSVRDFNDSGGALGVIYRDPIRRDKILANNRTSTIKSTSEISKDLFRKIDQIFKDFGYGKSYYGENEFIVYNTKKVGDSKICRMLDFYNPKSKICIEFQGSYWHPRNIERYGVEKVEESIKNDLIRDYFIKKSISDIKIYYIYEDEYINDPDFVIDFVISKIIENELT